jgi:uncharacterized protein YkwD
VVVPRKLLVAALAVALALVVPTAEGAVCAQADAMPAQASRVDVERATLCAINLERREHGLARVERNRELTLAARRHSLDMVRRSYFAHTGFLTRIRSSGYLQTDGRWLVGETLAWGWGEGATPYAIVRAWMGSPDHRRILLRPAYREVGVGVVWGAPQERDLPEATFTADFGVTE